jgi:CO dehydrogenase/acetyl-CoA synthase beta subunit
MEKTFLKYITGQQISFENNLFKLIDADNNVISQADWLHWSNLINIAKTHGFDYPQYIAQEIDLKPYRQDMEKVHQQLQHQLCEWCSIIMTVQQNGINNVQVLADAYHVIRQLKDLRQTFKNFASFMDSDIQFVEFQIVDAFKTAFETANKTDDSDRDSDSGVIFNECDDDEPPEDY